MKLGVTKNAIDEEEGVGQHPDPTSPVASPDSRLAPIFTVDLTLDYDGVYLATCREVSEVFNGEQRRASPEVGVHGNPLRRPPRSGLLPV